MRMEGRHGSRSAVFVNPRSGQSIHISANHIGTGSSFGKDFDKNFDKNFGKDFEKNFDEKNFGKDFNKEFNDDSDDDVQQSKKDGPVMVDLELSLDELYIGIKKRRKITRTIKTRHLERTEDEVITIDVKPGYKEGTTFTFANRGDVYPGREPADIKFVIKQKPHPIFKRDNDNNLSTIIKISQDEAMNGFERKIKDMSGKDIKITFNNGGIPNSNYVHRIKGVGMPIRKEGQMIGYGDLLVGFDINFDHCSNPSCDHSESYTNNNKNKNKSEQNAEKNKRIKK